MYVEIAVNFASIRGTFHYHLPPKLRGKVQPGHLITAPFGPRRVQGIVLRNLSRPEVPETKAVEGLVDPLPVLTPAQLELASWISRETLTPLIDCLTAMLPPGLSQQADSLYTLVGPEPPNPGSVQARVLKLLRQRGPLRARQLSHALPRTSWRAAANRLVRAGVVERSSVLQPPSVSPREIRTARLSASPETVRSQLDDLGMSAYEAADRRRRVLELLLEERTPIEVSEIYQETSANSSDLRYLEERDLIAFGGEEVWRDPLEGVDFIPTEPPELTADQHSAWRRIREALHTADSGPAYLLHGVTGSGKTEIYLRAAAQVLDHRKTAIILVPEIALTPQTVRRFLSRFPGQVGVVHSQLSAGERYDTWRRARSGLISLVIGPRSALFTPLPNIGLIAVDESHDDSYKSSRRPPRYHARETGLAYARILGAACILGTATPDVVTHYRAQQGELELLSLPLRIIGHRQRITAQAQRLGVTPRYKPGTAEDQSMEMPPVHVVDMRQELHSGNRSIFSRRLQAALRQVFEQNQQAILFFNRRGSASYVFCRDCGHSLRCPRCETPLTYHSAAEQLRCHHCGYARKMPQQCPNCGEARIRQLGAGTQTIQQEVERMFPEARTLRWDRDTTRKKGAHEAILSGFASQRADLLIGTQMVAKGLDLPLVTLVGVVSADTGLNLPDYRAVERTFQVLTQVAGRAGRGLLGGEVVLQTYQPEHYAIQAAAAHNYQSFYQQELQNRKELGYPPFRRLARLLYRHHGESTVRREVEAMAKLLRHRIQEQTDQRANLIGPVPCFYRRLRGDYRWHIVIRAADPKPLIPEDLSGGWSLDIDPVSLL